MDLETWIRLFGKTQDAPVVKAALAAAGVKRVPRLEEDDTLVQIELKGHGLEVMLTDEAALKGLADQDIGEGPLVLSGVVAKCSKAHHGRDLYVGTLPYGVSADMSQDAVRKLLGRPDSNDDDIPVDIWQRDRLELVINYTSGGKSIATFALMLPGAE
jgi:hypothetical protein